MAIGELLTPDLAPVELEIIVGGPGSSGSAGGGGGATYVYEVTAPEPSTWVMMLIGFAGLGCRLSSFAKNSSRHAARLTQSRRAAHQCSRALT